VAVADSEWLRNLPLTASALEEEERQWQAIGQPLKLRVERAAGARRGERVGRLRGLGGRPLPTLHVEGGGAAARVLLAGDWTLRFLGPRLDALQGRCGQWAVRPAGT
jgi:hypothetical protein